MRFIAPLICVACTASPPSTPIADAGGHPVALLRSSLGDAPLLEPAEFKVRKGQRVELRLKHRGQRFTHRLELRSPVGQTSQKPVLSLGQVMPGGRLVQVFKAPMQVGRFPVHCVSASYTPGPCGALVVQ